MLTPARRRITGITTCGAARTPALQSLLALGEILARALALLLGKHPGPGVRGHFNNPQSPGLQYWPQLEAGSCRTAASARLRPGTRGGGGKGVSGGGGKEVYRRRRGGVEDEEDEQVGGPGGGDGGGASPGGKGGGGETVGVSAMSNLLPH